MSTYTTEFGKSVERVPSRSTRSVPVRELLSPRQVAQAIGVSESSLKRWCDQDLIPTERTAGGHRRLTLAAVLAFVRNGKYQLHDASVLGLPANTGQADHTLENARDRLRDGLVHGDEIACRRIMFDLYLAENAISAICDQVLTPVFGEIGELWTCGDVEVYEERRACELSLRLIHELRNVVTPPRASAALAMGGTVAGDPYVLATGIVELVLRDIGWNAVALGTMLPFAALQSAMLQNGPRLFWLSVSAVEVESTLVDGLRRLLDAARSSGTTVVLGGRALTPGIRELVSEGTYCDTFQQLEDVARRLLKSG